ncbi:MAG: nucleotidyl transferase AbiEii/AbiGii toxin family protein, partial [Ignavibacteriaceae bacterium]
MEKELKLSILDKKRKDLLPLLKEFKDKFYLAGGTALALQLGHRSSDDFDFFSFEHFEIEA